MLAACVMNNVGVFWIAIELTTLISTFLVGFEREAESTEAAWKYIVVVSGGISLASVGTVLFYWGGSFVLGPRYAMTWAALHTSAPAGLPAAAPGLISTGPGRLWHEGGLGAHAHLAAGCS